MILRETFLNSFNLSFLFKSSLTKMASFEYNPIARSLSIRYICPECHQVTESDDFPVPSPNFLAEIANESETFEYYDALCQHCPKEVEVTLMSRYDGGFGEIDEVALGVLAILAVIFFVKTVNVFTPEMLNYFGFLAKTLL